MKTIKILLPKMSSDTKDKDTPTIKEILKVMRYFGFDIRIKLVKDKNVNT